MVMKKFKRKEKEYSIAKNIAIKDLMQLCYKSTMTTRIIGVLKDIDEDCKFDDVVDYIAIEYGLANLKNENFLSLLGSIVYENEDGDIRIDNSALNNLSEYIMSIPSEELLKIASSYNKKDVDTKNIMLGHQIFASAVTGKEMTYSSEGSDK